MITLYSFHLQLSVVKLIFRTGNSSSEETGNRECRDISWGLGSRHYQYVQHLHCLCQFTAPPQTYDLRSNPNTIICLPNNSLSSTLLQLPPLQENVHFLFSTHPTANSQIQQVSCMSSSILPQPALWSHSFDEWAGDINKARQ